MSVAVDTTDDRNDLIRACYVPLVIVAAAVLVGHARLASLHLRALWQQEQYQYFPFVIAAVIWLLVSRWQEASDHVSQPRLRMLPWLILTVSGLLLASAVMLVSGWLAFVALNVSVAALFVWLGRRRQIGYLWGIWLLLWLMVPPPFTADDRIVDRLQRLSSTLSSVALDAVGIDHLMGGNVLSLPDRELFVDEACSGIVSVASIVACAMIYAVWRNRSFVHLIVLTILGMCWATVMNVGRICVIAAASAWWGVDLSSGTPHELLGLMLFLLTFVALVCTDYLLLVLLAPIKLEAAGDVWARNWFVKAWNWVQDTKRAARSPNVDPQLSGTAFGMAVKAWKSPTLSKAIAVGGVFLALGFVQLIWVPTANTAEAQAAIDRGLGLGEGALPTRIGNWEFEEFDFTERDVFNYFGLYSKSYAYRHVDRPHLEAMVSVDFPYVGGWHDLCRCYRQSGWTIHERDVVADADSTRRDGWLSVEGELEDATRGRALVAYSGFFVDGELATPPTNLILHNVWFRTRLRLLHTVSPQLFQVQVFVVGDDVREESVRQDVRDLLAEVRVVVREQIAGSEEHGAG